MFLRLLVLPSFDIIILHVSLWKFGLRFQMNENPLIFDVVAGIMIKG